MKVFLIILGVLILLVVGGYFLTKWMAKRKVKKSDEESELPEHSSEQSFNEGESVPASSKQVALALYGTNEKNVDVTEVVTTLLPTGFKVANDVLKGDPVPGVVKKLTIYYK